MSDAPLIFTQAELRDILAAKFPFAFGMCLDSNYNVPTAASIDVFNRELGAKLLEDYGDKWKEFFDCDNFALEAIVLAYRKHWRARYFDGKGSAQGVAVGLLCFRQNPNDINSGHCVAFWVDSEKTVHVFEPQNRQPLALTIDQCASAFFYFVS